MDIALASGAVRVYYASMTNHRANTTEITYFDSEGEEVTLDVPFRWEICDRCNGAGTHDNPAFSDGISGEEWANEWDVEEREAYMSGAYDVRCDECEGSGKVRVPVLSAMTAEERKAYEEHLDNERYYARERAAEMRMGY